MLIGAWRLTLILDWEEIVRVTHDGLFWVGVASIVIALKSALATASRASFTSGMTVTRCPSKVGS